MLNKGNEIPAINSKKLIVLYYRNRHITNIYVYKLGNYCLKILFNQIGKQRYREMKYDQNHPASKFFSNCLN